VFGGALVSRLPGRSAKNKAKDLSRGGGAPPLLTNLPTSYIRTPRGQTSTQSSGIRFIFESVLVVCPFPGKFWTFPAH